MIVKLKIKILINGMFPLITTFKIDEYTQKTGIFDENMIDMEKEDGIFYLSGSLINSTYNKEGDKNSYYEYFENEEYIDIELSDDIVADKKKLTQEILKIYSPKVIMLQRRLRLITNIKIGLPVFKIDIYDCNEKYITWAGCKNGHNSSLSVREYSESMKEILTSRLRFNITQSALEEVENRIDRYKRALKFFDDSFNVANIGVRFTLLFSALEALFNIDGEDVTESISKLTSKILFLKPKKESKMYHKLQGLYTKRSLYIHGNEPTIIDERIEFELREIVRKTLLVYWYISYSNQISNASEVIEFLNTHSRSNIDLQLQLFIRSMDIKEYADFYNDVRTRLLNGETNIMN